MDKAKPFASYQSIFCRANCNLFLQFDISGECEEMEKLKIGFMASLPPIQSAINIDGQGNGARIKLDIPASEITEVLKLQKLAGKCFKVIIEYVEQKIEGMEFDDWK